MAVTKSASFTSYLTYSTTTTLGDQSQTEEYFLAASAGFPTGTGGLPTGLGLTNYFNEYAKYTGTLSAGDTLEIDFSGLTHQAITGGDVSKSFSQISAFMFEPTATGTGDVLVVRATGTDAFQGESNLTFDGSTLGVTGAVSATSSGSFAHVAVVGDVTASKFYGDGSNLTGVQQDIDTLTELDATPSLTEDEFLISDDGTEKRISMQNVANGVFQDVAGVVTVAAGGTSTLDLNSLGAAAVAVGADSIAIIDADDNTTKKEAVADVITAIAGAGTTATSVC